MEHMELGFALPVAGAWSSAESLRLVARRAEELGYHSLWTFQRLLHPAEGDWGATYRSVLDPLIALSHAAALTERVRLGVAVLNAPFFSPIVLAKQLASLDVLSGGRLDVGLGMGWADEEFAATGVERSERVGRTIEAIECLRAVWGPDPVHFEGEHVQVPESIVQPKPAQQPHPPLLMGASAPAALRRVGRLADGWISSSRQDLRQVGDDIQAVTAAAERAGRDAGSLRFVVRGVVGISAVRDEDGQRRMLTGTVDDIRSDLTELAAQGVTEVFIDPNFSRDVVHDGATPEDSLAAGLAMLEDLAPARTLPGSTAPAPDLGP
jgi:probable F420-dependent oxidoreductase